MNVEGHSISVFCRKHLLELQSINKVGECNQGGLCASSECEYGHVKTEKEDWG